MIFFFFCVSIGSSGGNAVCLFHARAHAMNIELRLFSRRAGERDDS